MDLRPRCLLQNWHLSAQSARTAAQTQLITRTLHACSELCRSAVQKHCQYTEVCCWSLSGLTNTNDRLVRINDHIISELASQVNAVSVLRFICLDLKILTALFGIFLQLTIPTKLLLIRSQNRLSGLTQHISPRLLSHAPVSWLAHRLFIILTVMTTTTSS